MFYLIFSVADRVCALPRTDVSEIVPLPRLWRPPAAPEMLAGLLHIDGKAVPVVSLRSLFKLGEPLTTIYQHIILIASGKGDRGISFLVDRVVDIVDVADADLRAVSGDETLNGCVRAEVPLADGAFAHLLAKHHILMEEEKVRLERMRDAEQSRRAAWGVQDAGR